MGNVKQGWYAIWPEPSSWENNQGSAAGHHGCNRTNVCILDGHAEALTKKELKTGKYTYANNTMAP